MRSRYTNIITAVVVICSIYACMKHDPYTRTCTLSTRAYKTTKPGKVIYHLKDSGAVFIERLSWHGLDGWTTVEQPERPFYLSFPVAEAAHVELMAEGNAVNGFFVIESLFITAAGDTLAQKDICAND